MRPEKMIRTSFFADACTPLVTGEDDGSFFYPLIGVHLFLLKTFFIVRFIAKLQLCVLLVFVRPGDCGLRAMPVSHPINIKRSRAYPKRAVITRFQTTKRKT